MGEEAGHQHQQHQLEGGGAQFPPPLLPDQQRGRQQRQGEAAEGPAGEGIQQQPADEGPDGSLYRAAQEGPDGDQQEDQVGMGTKERNPGQRGALDQRGQCQQGKDNVEA